MGRRLHDESVVVQAKQLYGGGRFTMVEVAKQLGVSPYWVHRAIHGLPEPDFMGYRNKTQRSQRCMICGRAGITRTICWTCTEARRATQPACQMVLSEWQTLADGTLMRTLTGT
jgi:hypothetical protein